MAESWAWEQDHGFDGSGHQRKEMCQAIATCPVCGADVELIATTECWVEDTEGRWNHHEYGPAEGVCCGKLIVDYWEGCFVYDLGGT